MDRVVILGHGVGVKLVIDTLINQKELDAKVVALVTHPFTDHKRDLEMIESRKNIYGDFAYNVFDVNTDFGIPVHESNNVNDSASVSFIDSFSPDYIISIGCRDIIKKDFLAHFRGKVFNMHTTPLPKYRGAASDSWMILNGEWGKELYGVFHEIDTGIDTGRIVAKSKYKVLPKSYPIDVFKSRMSIFPDLISKALNKLRIRDDDFEIQNHSEATTFPRLFTPKDGKINFQLFDGINLERFIYAFGYPFEGAFCFLGDQKINILSAVFIQEQMMHPLTLGILFGKTEEGNYKVSVNGGTLIIEKIEVNKQEVEQKKIFRLGRRLN